MNDLETRVRDALHEETSSPSVGALLDDVRRGARRRRARRTTRLAAAAALALAVTGGGFAWHHRGEIQAVGHSRSAPPVGRFAISVTGSGQVFKVTSNQGCPALCSTIWRRVDGRWEKLDVLRARTAFFGQAVRYLVMAPDGRNGWAWGSSFYSTHDGGSTWSRVTPVPYESDSLFDVQVGPTEAWVTSTTNGGGPNTLWHTPVDSEDWTEVDPPLVRTAPGVRSTPKDWDIVDVLSDGRVALEAGAARGGNPIYVGDGNAWREELVPCRHSGTLLDGYLTHQDICGPVGRYLNWGAYPGGYSSFQVGLHPSSSTAPVGQPDMLYVRSDRASIDTPSGVVPSDLRLGADDEVVDRSQSGDHVAILTRGHRIFVSDDSGRHWHELP